MSLSVPDDQHDRVGAARRASVKADWTHAPREGAFPLMIIAGASKGTYPYEDASYEQRDDVARALYDEGERKLMYVSATRARDELLITGHGKPAPWPSGCPSVERRIED